MSQKNGEEKEKQKKSCVVGALIFEDQLNGYFARKRMLKGTEKATAIFDTEKPDVFISETSIGKSEFSYDKILLIAETERYIMFVFSENHAQVYDKSSISGGTVNEFKNFLSEITDKPQVGWTNLSAVLVNRYVCCECGYSEEWIDKEDIQTLKKRYK